MLPGQSTSPEWKAFSERRWNPGDSVVVTLYVGPSAERKVADRATYRELDVINRAVDDIQPSPYAVDGYRNFVYDSTASPPVQWNGTNGDPVGAMVCLDRNRPQYWLPNQMGLDFYRSLERKHPLYAGDKFGTANRWEATDGSYDDWADSLSVYEADDERSGATLSEWRTNIPAPLRAIVPGAVRLFSHAMSGSPLRMNTQQRIWDNPPDLAALLAPANLGLENLELTTIPLDGPEKKLRQFVENDAVVTAYGRTENRAYSLRRAEVRNRPFNSPGDLLKLPMIGFEVPLNTGMVDNGGDYVWRSTNAAINTRWKPAGPGPGVLAYWRQDTTLKQSVLATSPDTRALGAGFAALAELSDFNTITLSVGQARFRPILSDPALALSDTYAANYLHWKEIGTFPNVAMRAPHGWTPVLLLAGYPDDPALQPSWSSLPRHTLHYPPPLPVGRVTATAPVWDPPAQWYQWNNSNKIYSVDAPYLVQTEFLRDRNRSIPVFGALSTNDVEFRWPRERLDPPTGGTLVPLEAVEYPRAAMFVSQHDENLTEEDRAEGVFSWDANDGLENGTYVAYVATFVPRMGQSLLEANERAIQGSAVTGGEFENALMPQQNPPPSLPSGSAPVLGGTEPIAAKLCALDPATPHNEGDDRFDPVLALEFVTDPAVADRVRPPGYTPLAGGRPLAALPHPKDWYPTTTPVGGQAVSTATAYRADGDGMILYSGSGQVTWRARLVRVTDRFLALRVRNLGRPDQVACISGVVLAPARHTPGKINVNTVENTKTITGDATPAAPYTFGVFNPLLGLPGVVDVLANTRNPDPLVGGLLGFPVLADTDVGWPGFSVAKASVPDPKLETWPIPMALTGLQMPPGARTADTNDPNLLAPKNTGGAWNAVSDGAAALRLSSMMMTGRPGHFDGRYYENLGGLAAGAAKGGRLKATDGTYPLSNESMPERRFEEIDNRLGRMANLITTRSDVFEILVTVQAGNATDVNGDNRIDYRDVNEFSVMAESQGRVIYERRARTDRSDEAAK
jgi:hypothetical protein